MKRVIITIKNVYFTVKVMDSSLRSVMNSMDSNLTTYKLIYDYHTKKMRSVKDKKYYVYNPVTELYHFNINNLKDFMILLKQHYLEKSDIEIKYDKRYKIEQLMLNWDEEYKPRDYQDRYIDALTTEEGYAARLIDLTTGYGKGVISTNAVLKLNMKTIILVLPKYIEKWLAEIQEYTDVDRDEIYIVRGGGALSKLIEIEKTDHDKHKFIIMSIRTVMLYIKQYESGMNKHAITPLDLIQYLRVGILVNDEAHQEYHAVFKTLLYFNVFRVIGLSATLDSNQRDMRKMYYIMYPPASRISNLVEVIPYINVYAIRYYIEDIRYILYKRAQGYNHILYEQSILKNSIMTKCYLKMIVDIFKEHYVDRKLPGETCLIYSSSIRMASIISNYIESAYTALDVRRYVEDDPYSDLMGGEVVSTTPNSASTAIDKKKLITVIQTVSMSSLQANIQTMGRLRKIDGRDTRYIYIYTPDIPNQQRMHQDRKSATIRLANDYNYVKYDELIRVK